MIPLDDDTLGVQLAKCQRDREEVRGYLKAAALAFGEASREYAEWETRVTRCLLLLNELEYRQRIAEHTRLLYLQLQRVLDEKDAAQ